MAIFAGMDAKERKFLELMDGFIIQARKDYTGEIVIVKGKLRLLIHLSECGKLKKDSFCFKVSELWTIFQSEFEMEYQEAEVFIRNMLDKHFGWNDAVVLN